MNQWVAFPNGAAARVIDGSALHVALELVSRLNSEGLRYGVYKNTSAMLEGLAGNSDLDLIVAAEDATRFRAILRDFGAVQGVPHKYYDNVAIGREDWFVPDESGKAVHLDISFDLRLGRKYRKRYLGLKYSDICDWRVQDHQAFSLPFVPSAEEAKIAILRSIFRLTLFPTGVWVPVTPDCNQLLANAFPELDREMGLTCQSACGVLDFQLRRTGDIFEIDRASVKRARATLRAELDGTIFAASSDLFVHYWRKTRFFIARQITRVSPARSACKRSIEPNGFLVALVGPDGVGKTTQTARLVSAFQRKFRCTSIYLGSNDGSWMKLRAAAKRRFKTARRGSGDIASLPARREPTERGSIHAIGSAIWRLVIAMQRYVALKRAFHLSRSGAIVFTDRWPQVLEFGILDGPSVPPPERQWIGHTLWRLERGIYRRMENARPDLMIHLDCDFATSYTRKPGDILEEDFERRIALMKRMRSLDAAIEIVDARHDLDDVSRELSRCVWSRLSKRAN